MKTLTLAQPATYQIIVQAYLVHRWKGMLEGLIIEADPENEHTTFTGTARDQAVLHGWLRQIADLGLPILSVKLLETQTT